MNTNRWPIGRAVRPKRGWSFLSLIGILLALPAAFPNGIEAQAQPGGPALPDLADLARRGVLRAETRQVSVLVDGANRFANLRIIPGHAAR